jgi:diguanylate cyclase (GGDEF)-like protein
MIAYDVAGRYGGDEFCILLPDTELELAVKIANRIREKIENRIIKFDGHAIKMTASFGAVQWNFSDADMAFINRVGSALYQAKGSARNRVERA